MLLTQSAQDHMQTISGSSVRQIRKWVQMVARQCKNYARDDTRSSQERCDYISDYRTLTDIGDRLVELESYAHDKEVSDA
jgi:hypothetical protein